jgi:hypothetical protein
VFGKNACVKRVFESLDDSFDVCLVDCTAFHCGLCVFVHVCLDDSACMYVCDVYIGFVCAYGLCVPFLSPFCVRACNKCAYLHTY